MNKRLFLKIVLLSPLAFLFPHLITKNAIVVKSRFILKESDLK